METCELNPIDKTVPLSGIEIQSCEEINGADIAPNKLKSSLIKSESININETDTTDSRVDISNSNEKPKQAPETQSPVVDDLKNYKGLTTLQELARTAREAKERAVIESDTINVQLPTDVSDSNFLKHIGNLDNATLTVICEKDKTLKTDNNSETLTAICKQLPCGPLTRGARKSLESTISTSVAQQFIRNANSAVVENLSSGPSSLAVVLSNASFKNSNENCSEDSHSRSPQLLSPLSTVCQPSPTPPSLSSPRLPSLFDMPGSFLSSDSSSHACDNENQRSRSHSSPAHWNIYDKIIENDVDDDDQNDIVDFISNAMGSSACATEKSDSEWMIETNTPEEMPELNTPHTTPVALTKTKAISTDGLFCLLITEEKGDGARLKNSIQDALQMACIQIATPAESVVICNEQYFDLIWVCVTVPVKEELLSLVASVRCTGGKSKGARIIAIADKTLLVDLLLRLFDDVFLEPLPVMTIRHKFSGLCKLKHSIALSDMESQMRDLNTPESSLSLESGKSQSTPSDNGMDFSGFHKAHQSTTTATAFNKSPLDLDSPPSPAWCKVEHANKEKQRRVRIKDSCDQLRKLLPYVRGRKTDMASILEMTVDYLQIVNASLPDEFQTKVIELLSPDLPLLKRKLKCSETATASKPKESLDTASLNKPVFIGGKTGQICSSTSIITKPCLDKNNFNNGSKSLNGSGSVSVNNNTVSASNNNNVNRIITRSQVSNSFLESSSFALGNVTTKVEPTIFTETLQAQEKRSDSNANILEVTRKFDNQELLIPKTFHKREMPLNANIVCSSPKRAHVVSAAKTDNHGQSVNFLSGNADPSKSKSESALGNAQHLSGIQFPHMFTEGNISANRMFSTGHVSRSDVYPHQAPSYLNPAGPPRLSGVPCEGGEMVASVNNMFFDTAYYYYPSAQDSNNGNYFVNNAGSSEYVNPNAVLPVTSNSASKIANFNLGRRYERLSVSGESERYSETAIGSVSLHHNQYQQH